MWLSPHVTRGRMRAQHPLPHAPPPPHLKRKSSDTTVATEMGRCLVVKDKTTRESAGNTDSSKHEVT